jgi:hypothetical protein
MDKHSELKWQRGTALRFLTMMGRKLLFTGMIECPLKSNSSRSINNTTSYSYFTKKVLSKL